MSAAPSAVADDLLAQPELVLAAAAVSAEAVEDDSYTRPIAEPSPSDWAAPMVAARPYDLSYVGKSDDGPAPGDVDFEACCDEPALLSAHKTGGWYSFGYHSDNTRLSEDPNDLRAFNDQPDHLNLHQAWVYWEKVAEAGCCQTDWGYRVDILYGTDAQKTQAFGNPGGRWDASLDHGSYGWAIPQAYGELAHGDWSVKAGHFYTTIGYEVVQAPQNFFYSHSYTFFNSEPLTHTGVLGKYEAGNSLTLFGGWTLGWDTGFDQFGGGSSWLGGASVEMTDDVRFHYMSTAGDFGWRGDGYSHSVVVEVDVTCCTKYVLQTDYVRADDARVGIGPAGITDNEDVGINQYLFHTVNDCWELGGRFEWWKSNAVTGNSQSFYEITGGANYRLDENVVIRPEIRFDWTPAEDRAGGDFNNTVFGIDAVVTY